ncbi:MAG: hypothetical protein HFE67_05740 [Erysipelotrichaceae bacterium]|nr:hypothetical protein [Erysipelotrichaceae bacterium]
MKENILVIIADFYPFPSNNVICFDSFLKKLSEKYNVHIVTSDLGNDMHPFKGSESVFVYRVKNNYYANSLKWNEKKKTKLNKFLSYASKSMIYLSHYQRNVYERGYIGWDKKKVLKVCRNLIETKSIKKMISVSLPYITCNIAMKIKKSYGNEMSWSIVAFDSFYLNDFAYSQSSKEERKRLENNYFENADKIFVTPQMYNQYIEKTHPDKINKLYSLEYANFINNSKLYNEKSVFISNKITSIFYAGNLSQRVRPINQILYFLSLVDKEFKLYLVTKEVLDYCQKEIVTLNEKIEVFSRKPFDVVYSNEMDSDYLISIGNNISFQVPGKTFELMSTGKPIIHFSFIENDPVLDYLCKYKLFFCVKLYEDLDEQVEGFQQFFDEKHLPLSYEEVLKECPEYDPKKIVEDFVQNFGEENE